MLSVRTQVAHMGLAVVVEIALPIDSRLRGRNRNTRAALMEAFNQFSKPNGSLARPEPDGNRAGVKDYTVCVRDAKRPDRFSSLRASDFRHFDTHQ